MERVRKHLKVPSPTADRSESGELLKAPRYGYVNRIAVKANNQTLFIRVQDIDYVEAASNYAVLITHSENHVLRETLGNLEAKLPPRLFLRISRSAIVNVERIKAIQTGPFGEPLIVLQSGRQLPTTRGLREIQQKLQYWGADMDNQSEC
jgi:two-component system LytT family response regulator